MSDPTDPTPQSGLRRREVITGGAAGLGALVLGTRAVAAARATIPPSARMAASCVLSPEMTEGPYLRGHQKSDAAGRVRFDTVFPGWYRGRTPHIHLKVHAGGEEVHTGQLFMGEKVTRAVYRTRYYASRGQADTSHASDMIYRDGGARSTLRIRRRSGGRKGYVGRLELGVKA